MRFDAQCAAARFAEQDKDGDMRISLGHFCALQPTKVLAKHTQADIRSWFRELDASSDGRLGVTEYFAWLITKLATRWGAESVSGMFSRIDAEAQRHLPVLVGRRARYRALRPAGII